MLQWSLLTLRSDLMIGATPAFDELTLHKLAEWDSVDDFDEYACAREVKRFAALINQTDWLQATPLSSSYNNFEPVYVSAAADSSRRVLSNGEVLIEHPSLVFYFHNFVPIAALGRGSWSQYVRADGTPPGSGYSGLDLPGLIAPRDIEDQRLRERVSHALGEISVEVLDPAYFKQPAPAWFAPEDRSEGDAPWDRMFHLLFQFRD